jgi:hypothetical protein
MASVNLIYQKRSDEVARNATVTVSNPSADPDYGEANLTDEYPAKLCKIEAVTGWIKLEYPAKQVIQLLALIHTTLDAGLTVYVEGNDTDTWATPSFRAPLVIPAWLGAGPTRWPVNPWVDLTAVTPTLGAYDPTGFVFWRVNFSGTNSQDIHVGELWAGQTIRRMSPNISWGVKPRRTSLNIEHQTPWKVSTIYPRLSNIWSERGEVEATATLRTALKAHWDDVDGRSYPFLIVPDGTENDARLVRYETTEEEMELNFGSSKMNLSYVEVARGLRPGV